MKKFLTMALALVLALSAVGCSRGMSSTEGDSGNDVTVIAAPSSPERYSLGGGSSGGNFYLVGGGLATILNNALPEYFVFTAEETGGSTANLTMLQNGDIEVGISMTSSIYEALEGKAEWTGGAMDKLRGLVPLYPSYLTIYALASSGITTLKDFNGKIIGLGSMGAAMDSIFREALPAMGIKPAAIFNDGHGATATAVSDGQVDAALLFSLPPFSAITELEATQNLNFVGLTQEQQNYLVSTYPFYSADVMPAGSYKGQPEDLNVVSEWNMLVTSSGVPADYVYLMAKTLFESKDALIEVYSGLSYCTPENIQYFNIPLHAGVIRYLEEIGVKVPEELIPPEYEG